MVVGGAGACVSVGGGGRCLLGLQVSAGVVQLQTLEQYPLKIRSHLQSLE